MDNNYQDFINSSIAIKEYLNYLELKIPDNIFNKAKVSSVDLNDTKYIKCELKVGKSDCRKICNTLYGYVLNHMNDEYEVGMLFPANKKILKDEYDSSKKAWDLFGAVYSEKLMKVKKGYSYQYEKGKPIEVSGDIDFNFKMQKVHYFEDIIDNDNSVKEEYKLELKNKLYAIHELTYHPDNISIMPKSGGMNNIKQILGNDRPDTFLYTLKQYYENGVNVYFLNHGAKNPTYTILRNILIEYLDSFNYGKQGIYNYCNEIYHINDKEFINKLCEFGGRAILNAKDVEIYIDLALEFWFKKQAYYQKSNAKVQTYYQHMIKDLYEIKGRKYINNFTGTYDYHC